MKPTVKNIAWDIGFAIFYIMLGLWQLSTVLKDIREMEQEVETVG